MDNTLYWKEHVLYITSKYKKYIIIMKSTSNIKKECDSIFLLIKYTYFILSKIDYKALYIR